MQTEFEMVRKGYNKEQVDQYIKELQSTIDEYVRNEAQVKALIQNAEQKAELIFREAELEAKEILDGAYSKLHTIQETVQSQRKLLENFRKDYNRFILRYVNEVNKRDFTYLLKSVNDMELYIEDTIKKAEQTKNGYFVPNGQNGAPIIIVEPNIEDLEKPDNTSTDVDNNLEKEYTELKANELLHIANNNTFSKHLDKENTIELIEIQEALLKISTEAMSLG